MKTLTVISDTHIGTVRSSGTTLASQLALTNHIHSSFKSLLPDTDLIILGDIFDKSQVALNELLVTYVVLLDWLDKGHTLYLVGGNHDLEKTSGKLSSFDMLGELLKQYHPHTVAVIKTAGVRIPYGYVIPHMPNQMEFDAELAKVPECRFLFLHVNYNNSFAAQSDQSLNITKEQVESCKAKQIICGHEHQHKYAGKILLPGNQIATSVSDWQGCNYKYKTVISDNGVAGSVIVAAKDTEYTEQPWTDPKITDHKFVRIVGEATTEQAAQVVNAVAKFRAISPALVVANAVQIAVEGGLERFGESLESVRAFDVWAALGEVLEASEITTLQGLE